jgi:hypothetical protein
MKPRAPGLLLIPMLKLQQREQLEANNWQIKSGQRKQQR